MIPLERGHLVIAEGDVNADVVRETAGYNEQGPIVGRVGEAPEAPGRGDRGPSGENGEDSSKLHFELGCRLEVECQSCIYTGLQFASECGPERLTDVKALFAEEITDEPLTLHPM